MADTPSQRLWARWDEVLADDVDVRTFLPPVAGDPETLARAAERISAALSLREAVADFLDDLRWARDSDDVRARVAQEPPAVDERSDAYLAAVAEHVSAQHRIPAPAWCLAERLFLDQFWFPSATPALDARCIVESPAAFRRRNIFIGAGSLVRV